MHAPDRITALVDLSCALTGFERFELLGTGLVETYLSTLEAILPAQVLDRLLTHPATGTGDEGAEVVLGDPQLGAPARALILLWYTGTWNPLPEPWREQYGSSPLDTRHVVSAQAYRGGLQWVAAGAHPAGADAQGFGAWALPPGTPNGRPLTPQPVPGPAALPVPAPRSVA